MATSKDHLDRITAFEYDAKNQSLNKTLPGNQLTADATHSYQYDDNGNLTRKTLLATDTYTQYTYDAENRLVKVEEFVADTSGPAFTSTYRYDGLGRRIEKVANGQTKRYIYDGEDILLEYDGAWKPIGVGSCLVHARVPPLLPLPEVRSRLGKRFKLREHHGVASGRCDAQPLFADLLAGPATWRTVDQ